MENNHFSQQHETKKITENGISYFLKFYSPNSNEIKNEISWLTSQMLKNRETFDIPTIVEASIKTGFIKMNYIEKTERKQPSKEELIEYLTRCASDLHSIIKTKEPITRIKTSAKEYNNYVEQFVKNRFDTIRTDIEVEKEIEEWMLDKVKKIRTKFFTIVHRDLRFRHLLTTEEKPVLIDWEYTNISEPAQDLAKLIYDSVVNHNMDMSFSIKKVPETYSYLQKISLPELENKISTFLPIIPLEHCAAFIKRKPEGYREEVLKDLAFIYGIYKKEK